MEWNLGEETDQAWRPCEKARNCGDVVTRSSFLHGFLVTVSLSLSVAVSSLALLPPDVSSSLDLENLKASNSDAFS